jgi:hypothetical protein
LINILEKLYFTKNRRKLYNIQHTEGLLNWIDIHCNPLLLNDKAPKENLLHKKIWTIFHPLQEVICKNGEWLQFNTDISCFYCKRVCSCWKESAKVKQKNTMKEKYGYESPFQSPLIKEKIKETIQRKYGADHISRVEIIKQLKKEKSVGKYGVPSPLQSTLIKQKIKETVQRKYGVDNVASIVGVQARKEQTCLNRYGEKSFARIEGVQEKRKQTCLHRYGVTNMLCSSDFQKLTMPIRKENNIKKYGVEYPRMLVMSENTRLILNDSNIFKEMLLTLGFDETAKKLKIVKSTLYKYHKKYNLDLLSVKESACELEIQNWLTSNNISYEMHNRTVCKPQELDIYIPTYNLAIEFDGLYWHSESSGKDKNYHITKTRKCEEQGIQLIHIFEDEWLNHKDVCKSIIGGYLNLNNIRIPARKCTLAEVPNSFLKDFLNDNHLQGYVPATKNFVLIYQQEIVAAMTFRKPRYNRNIQWELLRLATKKNTQVIGGSQRLWSHFQKVVQPRSIVSYCDRRWFTGKIYEILGFTRKQKAEPTYWYTDYNYRFHRSKFTKKLAVNAALPLVSEGELNGLTEKQITQDILDLDRIWDCGQDSWIWIK